MARVDHSREGSQQHNSGGPPPDHAKREYTGAWHIVRSLTCCQIDLSEEHTLKLAGLGLLLSGWIILIAALPLLPKSGERSGFVVAGLALELVGLILLGRENRSSFGAGE